MVNTTKISNYKFGVIICLVLSVFWIFMGLDLGFKFKAKDLICYLLTLGGLRHTIMSICALILIIICARGIRMGYLGALILGITTFSLTFTHILYMLISDPEAYSLMLFGPLVWVLIQIPMIILSFKVFNPGKKERNINV